MPAGRRLDLLRGELGRAVSAELVKIPIDVELGEDDAHAYIADGGAADTAWQLLRGATGIDWVIAGKLLARKRPKLVPVYDRVVSCAYGSADGFWEWLHGKLLEDGGVLARRLDTLHQEAYLPEMVSRLRVLDVVFWMRHRPAHLASGGSGLQQPNPLER
ncbi:DUF6308 family protein [Micromonospora auratinigra]|uniref:DUF6308 family protein n=1 Tax=Micromonospora auratinigra TaxID=261654 RepID=UPI0022B22CDE|nr:DUF6308 family protein [Micromonospora auratinigra]